MRPIFFAKPSGFRDWLQRHHGSASEIVVGFWKVGTGKPSMTWSQSVDEAICFGWIDGVRRGLDGDSYTIRFTPRRPGSDWSRINVEKAEAAIKSGTMAAAGLKVYRARSPPKAGTYGPMAIDAGLTRDHERALKANKPAWKDWQGRAPSYRKTVGQWIRTAKREATREKRFQQLLACSSAGEVVPPYKWSTSNPKRKPVKRRLSSAVRLR